MRILMRIGNPYTYNDRPYAYKDPSYTYKDRLYTYRDPYTYTESLYV